MSKQEALRIYNIPLDDDPGLVEYAKKRMGISDEEYDKVMTGPIRNFRNFKTYKKRFEQLRALFSILAKANLVPMSFYLKYCFPLPEKNK